VADFALPWAAAVIDLGRKMGLSLPVDANQVRLGAYRLYFDGRKAWQELGLPQVDMRTSIKDTYAWYAEHGYLG
jgi:hypothetical protein